MEERNETNLVLLAMNIIMKKDKYFKHSYLYNLHLYIHRNVDVPNI